MYMSVPNYLLYLQGEVLSVLRGGDGGRGGRCGCGGGAGSAGGVLVEGGELLELIAVEVALVRHLPEPLVQVGHLRTNDYRVSRQCDYQLLLSTKQNFKFRLNKS